LWNGELMINTNDGYYFASAAQKWLEGTLTYNSRVLELFSTATVTLTAFITKFTPFSLETVVLYMPAFISSLVVIPIILIGRLFSMQWVGFFAALLGSITWSYYNRTMVGYFDTDMFSTMAPMFILYFLLATIKTEKMEYALLTAMSFLIYPYLYDQGKSVIYAMGLIYMVYMVAFHRKDKFTYHSILLITVGLVNLNVFAQLLTAFALYYALKKEIVTTQQAIIGSVILIPTFLYTGNVFNLIWLKMSVYLSRGTEAEGLHFYQVSQTIREAGIVPFDVIANRISGSLIGLFISLGGYVVLVMRKKEFILALPLIGIGLFSLVGGLRFTVFAVPLAAISAVFFLHVIASYAKDKRVYVAILASLTALLIYPNITHIIAYKVPTVFTKQEVQILDNLKQDSSSKDYMIAWWDYGYPLWFYADKNTLIDGGKHQNDNFIVSEILLTT